MNSFALERTGHPGIMAGAVWRHLHYPRPPYMLTSQQHRRVILARWLTPHRSPPTLLTDADRLHILAAPTGGLRVCHILRCAPSRLSDFCFRDSFWSQKEAV